MHSRTINNPALSECFNFPALATHPALSYVHTDAGALDNSPVLSALRSVQSPGDAKYEWLVRSPPKWAGKWPPPPIGRNVNTNRDGTICMTSSLPLYRASSNHTYHFAVGPQINTWLLRHAVSAAHVFRRFHTRRRTHASVGCSVSHMASRLYRSLKQDAWATRYKHTDPSQPHIRRNVRLQESDHRTRHAVYFLSLILSVKIVALSWRVVKDRDILCVIGGYIFWWLVNLKFWKVTVASPQLVHVSSRKLAPWAETVLILFGKPSICSDNSQQTQDAVRLFQMRPVYEYFLRKYRSLYSPKPEMSLDDAMNP
jgi:hypothetical protein